MKTFLPASISRFAFWILAGVVAPLTALSVTDTNAPPHARWEADIRAFEAADKTNPPPKNAVLFVGSSSIRLWKTAPAQFPQHRIINRGFGGSHLSDSVALAERIVIPYQPKLILLYAGDNDIAAGKSPEQVRDDFQAFVAKVQTALPETRIGYLAIKPSPSRAKFFQQHKAANELIREFIATNEMLLYVDVFTPTLGADGKPRQDLFLKDQLHLNEAGYKLWSGIVGPVLDKVARR